MNKNKNKIKMNKNSKRKKYNNNNNRNHKVYKFTIKSAIVKFVTPDYTEKNLKFDIYEILSGTEVFDKLRVLFLQFKLKKVMFAATPRTVSGTDPTKVWIYLDTAANNIIHYASIQELQGSRALPVKRFSITSYSTTGRQDDFNYWYDCQQYPQMNVAIRLHSEAYPTDVEYWQFQLGFQVEFRGLVIQVSNNLKGIKQEKETETKLKGQVGSVNKEILQGYDDVDWNDVSDEDEEQLD
jgi:hypothetical protein